MATTCSVLDGFRRRLRAGSCDAYAVPDLRHARWCWVAGLMVPMCGFSAPTDTLVVEDDASESKAPQVVVTVVSGAPRPVVLPGVPAQWQGVAGRGHTESAEAAAAPGSRVAPTPMAQVDVLPASLVATAVQQQGAGLAPAQLGRSVEGMSYRWWLSHGRSDLGLGMGVIGLRSQGVTPASGEPPQAGFQASQPLLTVGWRYQVNPGSVLYADAYGLPGAARPWSTRGMATTGDLYSAKVGVEWARQRNGWGFERGGLGLQLDGGSKMSLRLRRGGVGVYMRSQF